MEEQEELDYSEDPSDFLDDPLDEIPIPAVPMDKTPAVTRVQTPATPSVKAPPSIKSLGRIPKKQTMRDITEKMLDKIGDPKETLQTEGKKKQARHDRRQNIRASNRTHPQNPLPRRTPLLPTPIRPTPIRPIPLLPDRPHPIPPIPPFPFPQGIPIMNSPWNFHEQTAYFLAQQIYSQNASNLSFGAPGRSSGGEGGCEMQGSWARNRGGPARQQGGKRERGGGEGRGPT
ncbi:hypothetical protein GCK72_011585 [Caenorhabditis remanei]|uniref:Uncharacterized protein n=1 Tax=Caenorhabditis remanei TaxID=31234 RepID=A0A6A5H8C8_CAERE|nr:hypothetical protein GCK72_011585 [Caenorhabditis remanei]KAF1763319.1 hypothetical protein GCK72_011585 [Caenorhabditis remanei]